MENDYDFADILDCREVPGIDHFIVVLGIDQKGNLLYSIISSKYYKAFAVLCDFLNDCRLQSCKYFGITFSKEKKADSIFPRSKLSDAFFLDKSDYSWATSDSVIYINNDALKIQVKIVNELKNNGKIQRKLNLTDRDIYELKAHLENSPHISPSVLNTIRRCFNIVEKSIRGRKTSKA